jgi:hypothetical protein
MAKASRQATPRAPIAKSVGQPERRWINDGKERGEYYILQFTKSRDKRSP